MFEAIHGSAPRMVNEGREDYADPSSMIKAAAMLMRHIGYEHAANSVEKALTQMPLKFPKLIITGHSNGASGDDFMNALMSLLPA